MFGWFKGKDKEKVSDPKSTDKDLHLAAASAASDRNAVSASKLDKVKGEYLDELPPKFEDDVKLRRFREAAEVQQNKGMFLQALGSIGVDDFMRIPSIPCMGRALGTGAAMATSALIVMRVLYKRPISRSRNWGAFAFTLGSIASWEQCRFQLKKLKEIKGNSQVRVDGSS